PATGIGYSPPARKLAVSPDSATRFGSASARATPRCSSALIKASAGMPLATRRPIAKPKGDAPDKTPAATAAESDAVLALPLAPREVTPGLLKVPPPPCVIGRPPAGVWLPTLIRLWPPN